MTNHGMVRRLVGGVSGHAIMRAALIIQSIALVPVLIHGWGVNGYGAWLALTALGSYAGLTNFGLTDASGSAMLLATGAGDTARAQRIFTTTVFTLAGLALPVIALIAGLTLLMPMRAWLHLDFLSAPAVSTVLILMTVQVWLATFKGTLAAAISTTGRFGLSNSISASCKLAETALIVASVLMLGSGVVFAATLIVSLAALDLLIHAGLAWRLVPWIRMRATPIDRAILAGLIRPSLGNLILQLGVNAIVVQGPRVALSALAGPAAVAAFSVHVTAARLTQQVVSMLAGPMMLEMSLSLGRADRERATRLLVAGIHATTSIGFAVLGIATFAGFWLVPLWTGHAIPFEITLFAIVGAMGVINNAASIPLGVLVGANRVLRPAIEMTGAGAAAIAAGALLTGTLGVYGMAIGCVLAELLFLAIVIKNVPDVLHLKLAALLRRVARPGATARLLAGAMRNTLARATGPHA